MDVWMVQWILAWNETSGSQVQTLVWFVTFSYMHLVVILFVLGKIFCLLFSNGSNSRTVIFLNLSTIFSHQHNHQFLSLPGCMVSRSTHWLTSCNTKQLPTSKCQCVEWDTATVRGEDYDCRGKCRTCRRHASRQNVEQ